MIAFALALHLSASQPERCETVRHDHERFKTWAKSSLEQFEISRNGRPSEADRSRWNAYEKKVEATISELNRRFAQCQEN